MPPVEIAGLSRNAGDQVGIQQKVLAKRFAGVEPEAADDLAKRGQRREIRRVDR
jgi:hypothetical protein